MSIQTSPPAERPIASAVRVEDKPALSTSRPRSLLRNLVGVAARPGVLSFGGGLPASELLPTEEYGRALVAALQDPTSLQYRPPYEPLIEHIVQIMKRRGVDCSADQVLVTSGAQQGIQILAELLLRSGGSVLLEETTYTGIGCAIAPFAPRIHTVPSSIATGIDPNDVESRLASGLEPSFLYLVPDSANPSGTTLSSERRQALAGLARQRRLPILEDDPYGFLTYDGEPLAPIKSYEDDWVFYLGSFSKVISPALRLGWMVVSPETRAQAEIVKDALDLESSALTQRAVARYLDDNDLFERIERLNQTYRRRRDAMLEALDRHFPPEAQWSKPRGGFFVWVELPPGTDTRKLLDRAVSEESLAFVPGQAFAVGASQADNCLRLSFSATSCEQIADGIQRLASLL